MSRVAVYLNTPMTKKAGKPIYSVKSLKTNRIVTHTGWLLLANAEFRVQPAGRERVRREKVKNVHAFVVGDTFDPNKLIIPVILSTAEIRYIRYNPYLQDHFRGKINGTQTQHANIYEARFVSIGKEIAAWGARYA